LLQKIYANNCIEARERDVTGVPTFVINDEYTIVGAQNEQTFVELFEKIEKETMHRPNDETFLKKKPRDHRSHPYRIK